MDSLNPYLGAPDYRPQTMLQSQTWPLTPAPPPSKGEVR